MESRSAQLLAIFLYLSRLSLSLLAFVHCHFVLKRLTLRLVCTWNEWFEIWRGQEEFSLLRAPVTIKNWKVNTRVTTRVNIRISASNLELLHVWRQLFKRWIHGIQRINRYPVDERWQNKQRYPLDSDLSVGRVIHPLNYWGLENDSDSDIIPASNKIKDLLTSVCLVIILVTPRENTIWPKYITFIMFVWISFTVRMRRNSANVVNVICKFCLVLQKQSCVPRQSLSNLITCRT